MRPAARAPLVALALVGHDLACGHSVEGNPGQGLRVAGRHPPSGDGAKRAVEGQPVGIGKLPPRLGSGALEGFLARPVDRHRLLVTAAGDKQQAQAGA